MTDQPSFSPREKILFLITISVVTLLIVLDYSIANVAIPYIAGDLSVSTDQGIYVITFFSVGNSIGLALTGRFIQRYGQVRLLMASMSLFILFSWICGLSYNLLTLVVARFIQGFVAGPMIPLSQSLLLRHAAPGREATDLSIWGMTVVMGPVLGPLVGGYISYWYPWSWIFYINIPIGIACAIVLWILLRGRETPVEKVPADPIGIVLLCIAVTCFQIFLDKGQQWDWWNSPMIVASCIICVVCATYLVIHELQTNSPVLPLRLFKIPSFLIAIIVLMVSYAIYFGSIVLVPLWLQECMNYDAVWAGIAVCPLGIGPVFLSFFAPILIRKLGNVLTIILSFCLFGISAFYTSFFFTDIDIQHIAFSRFLMGFGFVCYIVPIIQIAIQDVQKKMVPASVGMFHFFRALSGALGASIFTTLWERRTIFHHERINDQLSCFNQDAFQIPDVSALAALNQSVDDQAAMLAINDAFYLMTWLYVGLVVLLGCFFLYQSCPWRTKFYLQNNRERLNR